MMEFIEKYREDIINHNISEELMTEFCDFLLELESIDRYTAFDYIDELYDKIFRFMYLPHIQTYYLFVEINQLISMISKQKNIIEDFKDFKDKSISTINHLAENYKLDYKIDIDKFNEDIKLENLLLNDSARNIARKYSVCEDMKKEITLWEK